MRRGPRRAGRLRPTRSPSPDHAPSRLRPQRRRRRGPGVKSGRAHPDVPPGALDRAPGVPQLRLVACPSCHTQYDVTDVAAESFACRCGETLASRPPAAVDAQIHRCGSCGALVTAEAQSCEYCGSEIVREPGKLGLICPECYARAPEAARFCTACGVAFRPEKIPSDGAELPCPACGEGMPPRQVAGASVNECLGCHGLWAPGESFDRLVTRALETRRGADPAQLAALAPRLRGANPAAQRVTYRRCPQCQGHMQRRNFQKSSGVILDTCPGCGTWLDADELEAIAGFLLSGGGAAVTPAPAAERRAAAAFARLRAESAPRTETASWSSRHASSGIESLVDVLLGLLR